MRSLLAAISLLLVACEPPCVPGEMFGGTPRQFFRPGGMRVLLQTKILAGTCRGDVPQPTRARFVNPAGEERDLLIADGAPLRNSIAELGIAFDANEPGEYRIELHWGQEARAARISLVEKRALARTLNFPEPCGPPLRFDEPSSKLVCSAMGGVIEQSPEAVLFSLDDAELHDTGAGKLILRDGGMGWLAPDASLADWSPVATAPFSRGFPNSRSRVAMVRANAQNVAFWKFGESGDAGGDEVVIRDARQLSEERAQLFLPSCSGLDCVGREMVVADDTVLVSTFRTRQWLRRESDGGWRTAEREIVDLTDSTDIDVALGDTYWRCENGSYEYGRLEDGVLRAIFTGPLPFLAGCGEVGGELRLAAAPNIVGGNLAAGAFVTDAGVTWSHVTDDFVGFYGDLIFGGYSCGPGCARSLIGWLE
ncbi:MAG: hypothetical protein Q8L48_29520 [Archangium sp.]|nr:hypothetical protein [Archangium sp.]